MEAIPECTCDIKLEQRGIVHGGAALEFIYTHCPLHKAAPEMLEVLEMLMERHGADMGMSTNLRTRLAIKAARATDNERQGT